MNAPFVRKLTCFPYHTQSSRKNIMEEKLHSDDSLVESKEDMQQQLQDAASTSSERYEESVAFLPSKPIVYKRRWFILLIYSMNTMLNGLFFMSLAPINNIAVRYYDVHADQIEWLSNIFMFIFIFLALPATYCISRWGIRPIIILSACLHVITTVLHYFGHHKDRFWLVLFGQLFAAVAYCMILPIPGKLSSVWFPETEAATATSIGVLMNLFGVAIGFLQPSVMIKESSEMQDVEEQFKNFYLSQIIMSAAVLLVTIVYQEKPPTPPCYNVNRQHFRFQTSLKLLWREKYFVMLSQCYGVYFGLFVTFAVLVNPLVTSKYPDGYDEKVGWMGFWCDVAGIIGCLSIGVLIDKFHAYRLTAFLLNFLSMIIWLVFIIVLMNFQNFTALFILYVALGMTGIPYFSLGVEQAAEITYPVSEEISTTIILIVGNAYGFIFIFGLGLAAERGYIRLAGYIMVALYLGTSILAAFIKTETKRALAEKEASSMNTSTIETDSIRTLNDSTL